MLISYLKQRSFLFWVILLTLSLIAARITLTLLHYGYLGIDPGAYLLDAKRLIGFDAPQIDFKRAPLGPGWLLVPFIVLFGDDIGSKLWTSIFSVFPLLPCGALLAYRTLNRNQAVAATALLTLNPWNWEQVITGALPAIGIGLIFLCLWGLIMVTTGKSTKWDKAAVIFSIGVIPYVNQTSTGLAAVAIPVFIGSLMLLNTSWKPLLNSLPLLAIGVALAVPAIIFYYGDVVFGSSRMSYPGPMIFVPTGYTAAWIVFFYAIPVVWCILNKRKNKAFQALGLTLFVYGFLGLFSSYDESIINILYRSQYIGSALLIILGVWYLSYEIGGRKVTQGIVLGCAVFFLFISSTFIWRTQPLYSDIYTPDMAYTASQIPGTYTGSVLVNTFPSGMWLAAITGRPAVWLFQASPPEMYIEEYADSQCLLGWKADCDPIQSAKALDVEYLLLNMRPPFEREPNYWGAPPRDELWNPTEQASWLVLLSSRGSMKLWGVTE